MKRIIYNYILISGILILSACSSMVLDNTFCKEVLGLNISIDKELYKYEENGIRGKGILFAEYSFHKKADDLLIDQKGNYPHIYDIRKNWELSKWEKSQLADKRIFEFIDEYNIIDEKFRQYTLTLQNLASSENNILSYYYKERNRELYALEIYLVDTLNNKLYVLYMKV